MKKDIFLLFIALAMPFLKNAQSKYSKDFDYTLNTLNTYFAYADSREIDLNEVKKVYAPIIDTITKDIYFIKTLEHVLYEWYNGHLFLDTNLPSSYKLIPSGSDIWVEYLDQSFKVTDIKSDSSAEKAGIIPGMVITHVDNIQIFTAIKEILPKSFSNYTKKVYEYAANVILAGKHNKKRTITVHFNNKKIDFDLDKTQKEQESSKVLEIKVLERNIAYLKINNALGEDLLINRFATVVDSLSATRGMILDLRNTPSGGNTTIARAIMGKFISKAYPYQKHEFPAEERKTGIKKSWIEYVSPYGTTYTKPLVILVGRWTGSMGEGLAIGFDGMKRGIVVGRPMAGLLGAIECFKTPETQIGICFPIEKLFHINGIGREDFIPDYQSDNEQHTFEKGISILHQKLIKK